MSFHFGIYRFGFLLSLFITSFGIWLSTITSLTLSAHYGDYGMIESFQAWASSPEAHELLPYFLLSAVGILLVVVSVHITTREP
ncbi:TPA: hypothetical protein NJ217_003722 [Vibrio parahaemolyticus]|nr:hypothetical protein [Vibrio parahaemolyticus]